MSPRSATGELLDAIAALRNDASGKTPPVDAATTSSTPSAPPEDRAERRQVTVMFSDLVGSTALSARMDPEDLREVISAYQKCAAETVRRFGGFVAQYMATPHTVASSPRVDTPRRSQPGRGRHRKCRRKAAPHRRRDMVDQEISQHRAAEGSDERCHHRVSQGRVPLSQTESAKESGHYPGIIPCKCR